jgi:hypothetical protein
MKKINNLYYSKSLGNNTRTLTLLKGILPSYFANYPHFKKEYCHHISSPNYPHFKRQYCHHILPIIHIKINNIAIIFYQLSIFLKGILPSYLPNLSTFQKGILPSIYPIIYPLFFHKGRIVIISCHSSRLQKENLFPHPIVHLSAIHHDQVQAPGHHCKINLITTNKEGLLLANFVIERGILKEEKSILTSARKSI